MKTNMKKLCIMGLLSLMFGSLTSQTFNWAKREGLWAYDYGYGISTDPNGNVYLAGKFEMNAKFSGVTLPCQGNHDIYVAKYNSSGGLIWVRSAGGYSGDYAHALASDNSFVYIAGEIEGGGAIIKFLGSPVTLQCKGSNDIFLAKYDLNGNILWAKRAGDVYDDKALGITSDNLGNIFICGYFNTKATFGGTTIYGTGGNDIFVAKYDMNGNFLWVKKAGGAGRDEAKAIKCDPSGNVYVCGMFNGAATFGSQTVFAPNGYWDMFVAKYATDGTLLWLKTAGGNYDDVAWGLTTDNTGKVFVAGEFNSNINFGGYPLYTAGSSDVFVTCYNPSGTVLWAKRAGGYGQDLARAIGSDGNNVFITGQFGATATFGSFTKTAVDNQDIFIAGLNNSGQFTWAAAVGGPVDAPETLGYESGDAICARPTGEVYAAGALLSGGTFGSTYLTPYSRTDVFITKLKSPGAKSSDEENALTLDAVSKGKNVTLAWSYRNEEDGYFILERSYDTNSFDTIGKIEKTKDSAVAKYSFIDDIRNSKNEEVYYRIRYAGINGNKAYSPTLAVKIDKWRDLNIDVYPNPAKNSLTVAFNPEFNDKLFSIFIYDLSGSEISKSQVTTNLSQIDISTLPPGIYFIEISSENKIIYKKKFIFE